MRIPVIAIVAAVLSIGGLALAAKDRSGKEVFKFICYECHESGALDAPIPDSADFDDRLKNAGSIKKLIENAINGVDEMPSMGGCDKCTEGEIGAAVRFMFGK